MMPLTDQSTIWALLRLTYRLGCSTMDEWQRFRAGYLAVAIGCASIIMAFALAGMAVRNRLIAPPWLHVQLGDLHLVAITTPVLSEAAAMQCQSHPSPCVPTRMRDQYSLWMVDARQLPSHPEAAFWHVLAVQLE